MKGRGIHKKVKGMRIVVFLWRFQNCASPVAHRKELPVPSRGSTPLNPEKSVAPRERTKARAWGKSDMIGRR